VKILTVIPARGGSKGVPGKNIKPLGGKPLLEWTLNAALQSSQLNSDTIFVNTDDDQIALVANQLGAKVYRRPGHLGNDSTATVDVLAEMLQTLQSQENYFDAVLLLQATYPFRESDFIDRAIEQYIKTGADSLISVLPVPHQFNPHWVFEDKNGFLHIPTGETEIIKRRQDLPDAFHRDGAIYISDVNIIGKENKLLGNKLTYILSNPDRYVNIDIPADWIEAERLAALYV
jgi:CMP-N,N'-diacetyllegionaminic acid synthase